MLKYKHILIPLLITLSIPAFLPGVTREIGILQENLSGSDMSFVRVLGEKLCSAGFKIHYLSGIEVCEPGGLDAKRYFLYVVANAPVYPNKGIPVLDQYLKGGGNLMLLGAPAFTRPVWFFQGRWIDTEAMQKAVSQVQAEHIWLDFERETDVQTWQRATNDAQATGSFESVSPGANGTERCVRMCTSNLTGWDGWYSRKQEKIFPAGHGLLCFWAKGDEHTDQMMIEIQEVDGSRWMALAPLRQEWDYLVLRPEDFQYWIDSPTRNQRGGPNDRLNPDRAVMINFGLAFGNQPTIGKGAHTFWVDEVGTAVNPFAEIETLTNQFAAAITSITPAYHLYDLNDIHQLQVADQQELLKYPDALPSCRSGYSSHARFRGKGFGHEAKWRWMPLMEAFDEQGQSRGTVLWFLMLRTAAYPQNIITSLGLNDPSWLQSSAASEIFVELAHRIEQGVLLFAGGARHYVYQSGEKIELGAEVVNFGTEETNASIHWLMQKKGSKEQVKTETLPVTIKPGQSTTKTAIWKPEGIGGEEYTITTELWQGNHILDTIMHELSILAETSPGADAYVRVAGSDFYLEGRKWYPVGVNYWPQYVAGREDREALSWLAPGSYDPAEVEKDLIMMKGLGINMVSIQLGQKEWIRNLWDFLKRCERQEIKVNGYLQDASPLNFQEDRVRDYIETAKLENNTTLFAYDIIWEPGNFVFSEGGRPRWDRDWEKWLIERYGSIENAEKDWDFAAPRKEGHVSSPTDQQLREDGKWRTMVAAYRRFMDDLMSKKWNQAVRKLRAIDKNHLISFRQGNTLPHDFTFTATPKHIDFICPEGYSIPMGEDGYNAACFITRYVHFTTRGKPIIWSEFGKSAWDGHRQHTNPEMILFQSDYHEMFYRMVLESGANGTAPWWWPGGYRAYEKSDYGILNPDRTLRPSAKLLLKYAPALKAERAYPKANDWLTIDRDAHPGGYWYLTFNTGKDAYQKAREAGKNLGLRTSGTGTNSTNTPLLAVGNTNYNGNNPPKYLNAEFNWFQIKSAEGKWLEVKDGTVVPVKRGAPVFARASLGNLQEATWLTPQTAKDKIGGVYLASTKDSGFVFRKAIPQDTAYLKDADLGEFVLVNGISLTQKMILQMMAMDRAWFGEKLDFTLQPVDEE